MEGVKRNGGGFVQYGEIALKFLKYLTNLELLWYNYHIQLQADSLNNKGAIKRFYEEEII